MNEKLGKALNFLRQLNPCQDTLKEIIIALVGKLKDEQMLRNVNSEVVSRINDCITRVEQEAARGWAIGDTARFIHSSEGRMVTIKISSINWKTVTGVELDGTGKETIKKWRVAPSVLKKVA